MCPEKYVILISLTYCEWDMCAEECHADAPHFLYARASFFCEHLFLMTWQLASLGKGYRDFPLHMGTETIFHTTGTTGNRAAHTLAVTATFISTLDLISQRCRMLLTEFKATQPDQLCCFCNKRHQRHTVSF